jgi:hypothetical protein
LVAELTVFSRLADPVSQLWARYFALRSTSVGFGPNVAKGETARQSPLPPAMITAPAPPETDASPKTAPAAQKEVEALRKSVADGLDAKQAEADKKEAQDKQEKDNKGEKDKKKSDEKEAEAKKTAQRKIASQLFDELEKAHSLPEAMAVVAAVMKAKLEERISSEQYDILNAAVQAVVSRLTGSAPDDGKKEKTK